MLYTDYNVKLYKNIHVYTFIHMYIELTLLWLKIYIHEHGYNICSLYYATRHNM